MPFPFPICPFLSLNLASCNTNTAFYPKNWPIWFNYTKTVSPKMLRKVSKDTPRSPLNIGKVKLDGIISPGNC